MSGWNEQKLDELFAAYRDALPDREPSAGFTPELWRRIDQKRKPSFIVWTIRARIRHGSARLMLRDNGDHLVSIR